MAVHVVLSPADLESILSRYTLGPLEEARGIAEGSINTAYYVTAGGVSWFLRLTEGKVPEDLEYEAALLEALARAELPVPKLVRDRQDRTYSAFGGPGRYVSIFHFMSGQDADPVTAAHVEAVGAFAGRMAVTLEDFARVRPNEFRLENLQRKADEIRQAIVAGTLDASLDPDLTRIEQELQRQAQRQQNLPTGTVHGDLFVDNVKFQEGRMVGVIDFEMTSTDRLLWELAVMINAWCFDGTRFDHALQSAALEGYQKHRKLTSAELAALPDELRLAAVRFAVSRMYDFELNPLPPGQRVYKDYRDYLARLDALESA